MKNGGLILWNAVAICEMSKNSWLMEKTPNERRFGEPFKDSAIPFGAMVEYQPIPVHEINQDFINVGKKVLP